MAAVKGPWKVVFEEKRGEPAAVKLDRLSSWSDSSDDGVKYFSGHGTYEKTVMATADWFKPGAQLWPDLGNVANVWVNRLIGDLQPTATEKYTFTARNPY